MQQLRSAMPTIYVISLGPSPCESSADPDETRSELRRRRKTSKPHWSRCSRRVRQIRLLPVRNLDPQLQPPQIRKRIRPASTAKNQRSPDTPFPVFAWAATEPPRCLDHSLFRSG